MRVLLLDDLYSIQGKTALITGGCRGIGRMMAEGLLRAGARVWVTGRDEAYVNQAVQELSAMGPCLGISAELGSKVGIEKLASDLIAQTDSLNILINNAAQYVLHRWNSPITRRSTSYYSSIPALHLNLRDSYCRP